MRSLNLNEIQIVNGGVAPPMPLYPLEAKVSQSVINFFQKVDDFFTNDLGVDFGFSIKNTLTDLYESILIVNYGAKIYAKGLLGIIFPVIIR